MRKIHPGIWVKNIYNHKIITLIYIVLVRFLSEIRINRLIFNPLTMIIAIKYNKYKMKKCVSLNTLLRNTLKNIQRNYTINQLRDASY